MNKFGSIYLNQKPAILLLFMAASVTIVIFEVGCSKIPIYKNQNNLLKLQKGMSKGKVLEVMGEPNFHEVYESLYGHTLMIAY